MKPEFTNKYSALKSVFDKEKKLKKSRIFRIGLLIVLLIMFLPWNQTVISTGNVSTLYPNQRPQAINSVIPGKIKEWKVREGDLVQPGDTLVLLTETKEKYFDSSLISRMKSQIKLKSSSLEAYQTKVQALDNIIGSLKNQLDFKTSQVRIKLEQTHMKLYSDSIAYLAKTENYELIQNQFKRYDSLYKSGIVSNTSLENRRIKMQQNYSYMNDAQVKFWNTKNDLNDLKIELQNIKMKFQADQDKMLSNKLSSIGLTMDTENQMTKLQNELENYQVRNNFRVVTAETEGYITSIYPNGKGETVKEGEKLLTIMPLNHELTGEIFISPMDIPLIHVGEKVQVQFDGWPSIVFSGWPDLNYGSFVGEIYGIDQFPSSNGKFRVLIKEVPTEKAWPKRLSFGSGIRSTILLNKVTVGYELWRNVNGFPADFYAPEIKEEKNEKK